MTGSTVLLRSRGRRYAALAWRRWLLGPGWGRPAHLVLPGGRVYERRSYIFWRIRLPAWALFGGVGYLAAELVGLAVGLVAALLAEVAVSFRRQPGGGATPRPGARPGPGDPSGVREPRRPRPPMGADSLALPLDDVALARWHDAEPDWRHSS